MSQLQQPPKSPVSDDLSALYRLLGSLLGRTRRVKPWAVFAIGLSLFAICFMLTGKSADNIFCAVSDDSVVACVRNWVNALGTSLSALIALVTALIVIGQLRVSRKQAELAAIPSLDYRLESIVVINSVLEELKSCADEIRLSLFVFRQLDERFPEQVHIETEIFRIVTSYEKIIPAANLLEQHRNNFKIDFDIRRVISETDVALFLPDDVRFLFADYTVEADKFLKSEEFSSLHIYYRVIMANDKLREYQKSYSLYADKLKKGIETLKELADQTSRIKGLIINGIR